MKRKIFAGTTSFIDRVFVRNTSTTSAVAGLTGLTSASAGLTLYYIRAGSATATAVTLSAGTVGTWSSGGFKEIDATNMPGWYELGIPNAVLAAGSASVGLHLKGAANMEDIPMQIELDGINYAGGVVPTVTTLTSAPADSAGTTTLLTRLPSALTLTTGKVDVNDKTGFTLTQAFPANFSSLAIAATGQVGLDFSNIKQATGATTLTNITIPAVTLTGTTTTLTNKTGFGLSGTQAFNNTGQTTNIPADLQTIKTQAVIAFSSVTFPTTIGTSTLAAGAQMDLVNSAVAAIQSGLGTTANQSSILTATSAIKAQTDLLMFNGSLLAVDVYQIGSADVTVTGGNLAVDLQTVKGIAADSTSTNLAVNLVNYAFTVGGDAVQRASSIANAIGIVSATTTTLTAVSTAGAIVDPTFTHRDGFTALATIGTAPLSAIDDFYKGDLLVIPSIYVSPTPGSGGPYVLNSRAMGQTRRIVGYNGTTNAFTVFPAFDQIPGNLNTVTILPAAYVNLPLTPPAGYGSSTGSGANTVTTTVHDALGAAVSGVAVRLTAGADVLFNTTGTNGVAILNTASSPYTLALSKSGYNLTSFTPGGAITASGNVVTITGDGSIAVVLTAIAPTPPATGNTRVSIYCLKPDGTPDPTGRIIYTLRGTPGGTFGAAYVGVPQYVDGNPSTGEVAWELPRNGYTFTYARAGTVSVGPESGIQTTPDAANMQLPDIVGGN